MRRNRVLSSPSLSLVLLVVTATIGGYCACSPSRSRNFDDGQQGLGGLGGDDGDENRAGAGGKSASGGTSATGGSDSGGDPAAGGTDGDGGTTSCSEPADCTPPDPLLCGRACDNGTCSFAPRGTAFSSGPATEDHRTGGFDGSGVPYLFWGQAETTPSGIGIQRLEKDGAPSSTKTSYTLPEGTEGLRMFEATFDGDQVGLLWNAELPETSEIVTQFDLTDVEGTENSAITLDKSLSYDKYPRWAYTQVARKNDASTWLLAEFFGVSSASWRATTLDPASPPASPPLSGLTLPSAPVCSDSGRVAQKAAVVGSTLYVSGYACDWYQTVCPMDLVLARYDKDTLELLDPPSMALTVTSVEYAEGLPRAPVFGSLGGKLAAFWSEFSSPTEFALGRALFGEDGSLVQSRDVVDSDVIPKAYVAVPSGGALVLVSRLDTAVDPPLHTLEARLVNAELDWVGEPLAIDAAHSAEPSDVGAVLSPDGSQVLVTFRQGQARHRLLHATLCW